MLLTAAACATTGVWSDGFAASLSSLRSIVVFLVVSALAYRIRYIVSHTARGVDALSRLDDALDTGEVAPDGAECTDAQRDADPSLRASIPPLPPPEPALLDVRGVALHYGSPPEIILRDLDLVVRDGERLAVIGGRGAGKTTLAQALLGEHAVMTGSIRHRGQVMRPHAGVQGSAGVRVRGLVQRMTLRDGTIADNLRIGNAMIAFEQFVEACRRMGIAEDIAKMPLRYETLVRRDGSSVSRAQRQLLLLARTIASPCDLFVVDDPVAHLSPSSARQVMPALTCLDGAVIAFLADPCGVVGLGFRIVDLEAARPSTMSHVVVS
ncbi:MAG: ABC-type bacteriocin transporter [Gemmatimonadetes bacterium]|nr:ABC-type bacteriocin transporter [Gemmatimonadota bacterium]